MKNRYSVIDNGDEQHPRWGKPSEITYYINVDRQTLSDLKLFRNEVYHENWNEATKQRLSLLKRRIEHFFYKKI